MANHPGGSRQGSADNSAAIQQAFTGHYRLSVKTSISKGQLKPYASLGALLGDLEDDETMRKAHSLRPRSNAEKQHPPSGEIGPPTRFTEEDKNVSVTAWICAVKYEDAAPSGDHDFHVILGDSATLGGSSHFMNVEVSGLPDSGHPDYGKLLKVRQTLVGLFPETPLTSSFHQPNPPIKVSVEGSLFFDGDHSAGEVGPRGMQPQTVWEIHPISSLIRA
jgi:hypothetical protein